MYVIRRCQKDGGGYVSKEGADKSYTHVITKARQFPTREAAEANLCPTNEQIVPIQTA